MPTATGGRWGCFWEQRARQLQRQVQAKEEWIVDLETENAVLHLRLAQEGRRTVASVRGSLSTLFSPSAPLQPLGDPGGPRVPSPSLEEEKTREEERGRLQTLTARTGVTQPGPPGRPQERWEDHAPEPLPERGRAPRDSGLRDQERTRFCCLQSPGWRRSVTESLLVIFDDDDTEDLHFCGPHIPLAHLQYQGAAGQSGSASAGLCSLCGPRARLPRSPHAALLRLRPVIQALKQDVKALHASFLEVFRNFWDHLQTGLSEVAEGVQRAQLQHQALLSWRSEAGHLERCLQEADSRYQLEKQRRKVLHNRLVELKGNIRVHCRIRPLLPFDEESENPASQNSSVPAEVVHAIDDETVLVKCDRAAHPPINNTYSFERYNVCIMAYGQTGCGKSYTMLGPQSPGEPVPPWEPHSDLGVLPRAARELFRLISENPSRSLKVDVSIVEVYNNDIFDLLAKDGRTAASGPKREVLTAQEAKQEVCLLTREPVHSAAEFMALAAGSLQLRAELATSVHANSSRSHLIITATLTTAPARGSPGAHHPPAAEQQANGLRPEGSRRRASGGRAWPGALGAQRPAEQVHAKLQLVDLAGSECVGVSGVTGSALRETSFINRSLAALADVLGALAERRGHVPYRNSKLTHFLQDVLGGDAKLLVILCVSPCRKHVAETLRCLGFGARARQVQRGQARGGSPAPRKPR